MSDENELSILLVRWVQAQVARHEVFDEPVTNLERETIEALRERGYMKDGVWTL